MSEKNEAVAQLPPAEPETIVLYVSGVPADFHALIKEEAGRMEVPIASYVRGILFGLLQKDRYAAFINSKSVAIGK